jgi:hypothetical protein
VIKVEIQANIVFNFILSPAVDKKHQLNRHTSDPPRLAGESPTAITYCRMVLLRLDSVSKYERVTPVGEKRSTWAPEIYPGNNSLFSVIKATSITPSAILVNLSTLA